MYGLTEIEFKHAWVYTPDADEITPDDLKTEMLAITSDPTRPEVFFKARYKNMFMGRWIKHASLYPTWITRLVRPDRVRFERSVHSRASGGAEGELKAHFIHYSFNKGLEAGTTNTTAIRQWKRISPQITNWNVQSIGVAFLAEAGAEKAGTEIAFLSYAIQT